ncbi:APG6-domain-containing protein [Ramicandelaber brevisporus]|nr:APG6-domain-containing protein [Ramicandelaber brevisporus]
MTLTSAAANEASSSSNKCKRCHATLVMHRSLQVLNDAALEVIDSSLPQQQIDADGDQQTQQLQQQQQQQHPADSTSAEVGANANTNANVSVSPSNSNSNSSGTNAENSSSTGVSLDDIAYAPIDDLLELTEAINRRFLLEKPSNAPTMVGPFVTMAPQRIGWDVDQFEQTRSGDSANERGRSVQPRQASVAPYSPSRTSSVSRASTDTTTQHQHQHQHQNQHRAPVVPHTGSVSDNMAVADKLMAILDSKSTVPHPLCQECTEVMLDMLSRQLSDIDEQRSTYEAYLQRLRVETASAEAIEVLESQLAERREDEQTIVEAMAVMESQLDAIERELADLKAESEQLDAHEASLLQDVNAFQSDLHSFQTERQSTNLRYDYYASQLAMLQRTNIYNDVFYISHDGVFGTINGLRMGRLASHPVDWSEINAAWGLAALLLDTIAAKLDFSFEGWRLLPLGSFSKIERIDGDQACLELYGSGDLHLGRLLQNRRFDRGMAAFLECVAQLGSHVETRDRRLRMPYRAEKDLVGGISIKLQFGSEEQWTRALKYLLTNLKWLLAYAALPEHNPNWR